jgi:hypothetical protein
MAGPAASPTIAQCLNGGLAGSRSSAAGARRAQRLPLNASAGHASGNWKRPNAVHAGKAATRRRSYGDGGFTARVGVWRNGGLFLGLLYCRVGRRFYDYRTKCRKNGTGRGSVPPVKAGGRHVEC